MKSKDCEAVVQALASTLEIAGASTSAKQLRDFAAVFAIAPSSDLGKILQCLGTLTFPVGTDHPTLGEVEKLLAAAALIVSSIGTKKAKDEWDRVQKFLRERATVPLSTLKRVVLDQKVAFDTRPSRASPRVDARARQPLKQDLVDNYQPLLESSLADPVAFVAIYNRLKQDSAIGSAEMSALAKAITRSGAKSREAALEKLLKKHQSRLAQSRRRQAVRGRSAA